MTPAGRHARVTALFHDALEQDTGKRAAWLERACEDDTIRSSVFRLLEAHETTDRFIDYPVLLPAATDEADETVHARVRGHRVGPWQIEDRIGEGGMGIVYRATRADGLYQRTVALKLIAPGAVLATGDRLARRLAAERQILARLEHDGIARLYDGGVTEDGLPYLALELVDGEPITTFSARHNLGADERVRLFALAVDAVAYAHRNLVVHRDLKPAHILVVEGEPGDEPAVKLLDFGVAELLDTADDAGPTPRTVLGALTPAYAAPEQVRGEPVTTLADVYALGVVLYELLAEHRPYEVSNKTAADVERLVAEVEPPPPSALAPPARARELRGDLDTIIMKALAKEPERRYASADALADDLRRHLSRLPVEARPATAGYRLGRFVRRNRAGVIATAASVLLVVALVGFYTLRLRAERDRAQQATLEARAETERAEAVAGFLEQIIRAPSTRWYVEGEAKGPDTPIRAVLDEAAARVDRDFAERPALRADLHHILGDTYMTLGLPNESRRHHLTVLGLRDSLYDPPHPKLAEALFYGAMMQRDRADYVRLIRRAMDMQRVRPEGNNFPFMVESLGRYSLEAGRVAEADALISEGLAFADARFVPGHDGYRYRDRILASLAAMRVRARLLQGDADGAERWLAYRDSLSARLPDLDEDYTWRRGETCARGQLHGLRGQFAEAERALLACAGETRPPALPSPVPRVVLNPRTEARLREQGSLYLEALYRDWGRPGAAAPYLAPAARYRAYQDSLRQAFREADASARL